ncbi:MAG TPA: prolyl oligopeptidase family serine peptidase [Thermoanaerobaculia bacterium]|nr:prolyl oligopeptidase family serine peptidase [Thermoanaerobaculia bacterium]
MPYPSRPLSLVIAAAAVAALLAAPVAAQTLVPLEKILGAPFPTQMTPAPSGGRIAWVINERGVRNLWVASPPDYRGRKITSYTADDGQDLSGLEWTPDGATISFVRGSGANNQGEVPNPAGNPAGAEQAVWKISAEGGEPVRIGPGSEPTVSPKGDGLVFLRRGVIHWASLGTEAKEPAPLIQLRGRSHSLRWSPDGRRLAFVSNRGTHSFVGIYDVAAKSVRFVSPSVDSDSSPAWSPDGRRLAFLRDPASSGPGGSFRPARTAEPWSVWVADAATGEAKPVWRAEPGRGSAFRAIVAENQLFWGAGDRLVFPWEREGWTHLYSVPVSGGKATLLTPGDFEVEYAWLTPDRTSVIYNSNQGDIDRRHVWRVDVAAGPPVALTRGTGIEWAAVQTSDGRGLAYFRSGAKRPAHAVISLGGGEARELAAGTIPADFPESALVEPQPVVFPAADGLEIRGQLFLPPGIKSGERRPALLFFHGGSRRQMLLGWHYSPYYYNAYAMNQHLASRGYVVLSVNYRSGIGYGLDFREALSFGPNGASEFFDVLGAGLYLRGRSDVDPARIGLWGGSYGGYLTAMGLARASSLFAAGVDFHGVHDWSRFLGQAGPVDEDVARLARESSPAAWLDDWRSPVLVIHGDDDRNVPFRETVLLVEELRKRNVEVEQLMFPDEVHSFLTYASWKAGFEAAADFFDRKLKPEAGGSK